MNTKKASSSHLSLSKILRELYLLFPDPNLYVLMNALKEPTYAQNPEELKKMIAQNLETLSKKKQLFQNQFAVKEKEVENFMQDPSNFLPEEWQAIQKIRMLFDSYQTEAIERIETDSYRKKRESNSVYQIQIPKKKRVPRRKDWLSCK